MTEDKNAAKLVLLDAAMGAPIHGGFDRLCDAERAIEFAAAFVLGAAGWGS